MITRDCFALPKTFFLFFKHTISYIEEDVVTLFMALNSTPIGAQTTSHTPPKVCGLL